MREWSLADFQDFSRLAKNPNVMRYINNGKLWDDHRIRKFIERQQRLQKQMGHCLWVIELQQKEGLIGFCGIAPFEPPGFLEIGWWFDESCWGLVNATEAANGVLDYAINELGITQLRSVSQSSLTGFEYRAPNPDHGRPFQDCPGVIGSHPHRKLIDLWSIEFRL